MKNVVFALIVFILAIYLILLMSRPKGYRHAIFRGAPTKVVLKVVDDTGKVVSGAHIEAIFNNYIREPKIRKGLTDKNGEFVAQHKSTGEIDYFITKKGYYQTKGKIKYIDVINGEKNFYDNKWQPYGKKHEVIIKPIKHPIKAMVHEVNKSVVTNINIGFDFKIGDYVKPHGAGEVADFILRIEEILTTNYWSIYSKMSILCTNNLDGAYIEDKDTYSEFKSEYHALTNDIYSRCIEFEYNSLDIKHTINTTLEENQYIVFRTRTKMNGKGELIEAYYTKVYTPFYYFDKILGFRCFHNPNVNDTNLEFESDAPWRHGKRELK